MDRSRRDVRLTVANDSDRDVALVLEPWGEVYPIQPRERRDVIYRDDPERRLTIEYGATEIKIWAEGAGRLEIVDPH
jgi:hypothetical protein